MVFIEGRPGSGGSVKNWTTEVRKGSVFEIRDLPRAAVPLVEKGLRAKYGTGTHGTVEVIENAAPAVDADALRLERERLASRIAEIDRLLGEAGAA